MRPITELLNLPEGLRFERKRTIPNAYKIARTLASFANTSGGTLLIGIEDDGKVVGVKSELDELLLIEKATEALTVPPLVIQYQSVVWDGLLIMQIEVTESKDKPHFVIDDKDNRTIYVRQKDKSVPTNRLVFSTDVADKKLLKEPYVKKLMQFLRQSDSITALRFSDLVNVSQYRAGKLLHQLAQCGVLIAVDRPRPVRYSLKV